MDSFSWATFEHWWQSRALSFHSGSSNPGLSFSFPLLLSFISRVSFIRFFKGQFYPHLEKFKKLTPEKPGQNWKLEMLLPYLTKTWPLQIIVRVTKETIKTIIKAPTSWQAPWWRGRWPTWTVHRPENHGTACSQNSGRPDPDLWPSCALQNWKATKTFIYRYVLLRKRPTAYFCNAYWLNTWGYLRVRISASFVVIVFLTQII